MDFEDEDFLRRQMRKRRIQARILDFSLVFVPAVILFLAAYLMTTSEMLLLSGRYFKDNTWRSDASDIFGIGLIVFAVTIYVVQIVLVSRTGQTLGKRFLQVRIVRSDGSRAGFVRAFLLRNLFFNCLCGIPVLGQILLVADVVSLWRPDGRCLHDRLAGTKVVTAESKE
jgi:uncharacterized RDD family membrane protein YckC